MTWKAEVDEIVRRRQLAEQMGGEEQVARHHRAGKLTVRERIAALLDEGSFREMGALTGSAKYDAQGNLVDFTPANVVVGSGKINSRRVVVSGEDFTIRAGSSEATNPEKWQYAEKMAFELKMPIIRLVDTAGGSIKLLEQSGLTKLPGYPHSDGVGLLGYIPVVAAALGSVAGLGAARMVGSHFSIMVKGTSQVFAAGPYVVKPATGEDLDKEALGGHLVHARGSGVIDNEAESELDAFDQIRRFLSYLPQNVYQIPPRVESADSPERTEEELLSIIPRDKRKGYDTRRILELVFDRGSLFEIGRCQGRSVISMFGRLNGYPVGIMANDPMWYAGSMTATAAEKSIRFIDLCDSFHLPIVNMVDQPGVMIGKAAEKAGTIRIAVRVLAAIEQSRTPWMAIILRKAFGVAGSGYGRQHDLNMRYAWPSGSWGSIPVEGGVEAAYFREIQQSENPEARLAELTVHYRNLASPLRTAERFGVNDLIDPRETRPLLCDWVEQAYQIIPQQLGPVFRTMRV
jgi:acetyl-CoA carboxylase carboxyltransferase component